MSPTNNFVRVLDVNPILVRALEAEMRVAEKQVEDVFSWAVQRLNPVNGTNPPGEGTHLERIAAARKLLDDAAANYLAVKSELDHARKPVELPSPPAVLTTTPIVFGEWNEVKIQAAYPKKRPAGPSSLRRPRQHKRGK